MQTESVTAGFYESELWGKKYPRRQLLTVDALLSGKQIDMPPIRQVGATLSRTASRGASGIWVSWMWLFGTPFYWIIAPIPQITADIFRDYVAPYNKRIVQAVKRAYATPPPAVIMGGNVTLLGDLFLDMGVSLVAVDYLADFAVLREKFNGAGVIVRGCVDPKMIERGDWDGVQRMLDRLAEKSRGMHNFVWGCGCVSCATPAEHLLRFKSLCADF